MAVAEAELTQHYLTKRFTVFAVRGFGVTVGAAAAL